MSPALRHVTGHCWPEDPSELWLGIPFRGQPDHPSEVMSGLYSGAAMSLTSATARNKTKLASVWVTQGDRTHLRRERQGSEQLSQNLGALKLPNLCECVGVTGASLRSQWESSGLDIGAGVLLVLHISVLDCGNCFQFSCSLQPDRNATGDKSLIKGILIYP